VYNHLFLRVDSEYIPLFLLADLECSLLCLQVDSEYSHCLFHVAGLKYNPLLYLQVGLKCILLHVQQVDSKYSYLLAG
jgi:hypothetical protein